MRTNKFQISIYMYQQLSFGSSNNSNQLDGTEAYCPRKNS